MNKVCLMGRLVKDPDVKYTQGEKPMAVARYTLAVDRRFKRDGEQSADFISCVAFGKGGEFVEKYLKKGMRITVSGHIQTGSYSKKDGTKVFTTEVVVDEHEFCESRSSGQQTASQPTDADGFMDIPDNIDESLPFN